LCYDEDRLVSEGRVLGYGAGDILDEVDRAGYLRSERIQRRLATLASLRVDCRPEWPVGIPMQVLVLTSRWGERQDDTRVTLIPQVRGAPLIEHIAKQGGYLLGHRHVEWTEWSDHLQTVPAPTAPALSLSYEAAFEHGSIAGGRWEPVAKRRFEWPIRIVPTLDDVVHPRSCPALVEQLRAGRKPIIHESGGCLFMQWEPSKDALLAAGNHTFAVTVDVLSDGKVVATGEAWWWVSAAGQFQMLEPSGGSVRLRTVGALATDPRARLSVRLTSNPIVALRNFRSDRYWTGVLVLDATFGPPRTIHDRLQEIIAEHKQENATYGPNP
jgi:hypothetical protein